MKKVLILFFVFVSINCLAQFSKTHYIPPLSGSTTNSVLAQEQYLYISTPSITPVNVKINAIGVGITNISVSQNSPYASLSIGSGNDTQLMTNSILLNTPLSNKGYIIEAESLVYVAIRVLAGNYNQAGSLVSKGMSALGKEFRVGAFINTATTNSSNIRYTFLSILATEDNTSVEFKDIKTGVTLLNNTSVGNTPPSISLNRGQSYVLATEDISIANKDGLIGALVKATKPIAFNCGSFGGTNGDNNNNLDLGFDQIVPIENIKNSSSNETKYIFVRGFGPDITERPLIVAHEDNTEVFINEVSTMILNAGQYLAIGGDLYGTNGNMYVRTTKPVFAYQSVGGSSQANQEMFFVPPLNCSTPNIVNNIPFIEQIGSSSFTTNSGLNIVTETGATLEIGINGINYPITSLPSGVIATRKPVTANNAFEVYSITGLLGNVGVFSNKQVYVSYFGSSGAATYGGYYSGFDLKPEIISEIRIGASSSCIPDVVLKISTLTSYDSFEWFKNDVKINGETSNAYTPTEPGFYQVKGTNSNCGNFVFSDKIPVSSCPTNNDIDAVNDNIDVDNDNDGILNCIESYGNQNIDTSNATAGTISVGTYSNLFIGTISTTGTAIPAGTFTGSADGSFITEIQAGKANNETGIEASSVTYTMNFNSPMSAGIEYGSPNSNNLLNADAEYVVNSDLKKTITVLNPDNQLLIDTNYDGIYETGITQYSSFEIRFRLNGTLPLAAGSGKFRFLMNLATSISFTHKNLSDTAPNRVSLKFFATCIPKDSDGDLIPDQLDLDSDNDGIPDNREAQGEIFQIPTALDNDLNGWYDTFQTGIIKVDSDSDGDGTKDYLDLDSDNDGINDLVESGSNATDSNLDGIIDGIPTNYGNNGLSDTIETLTDSGILNYTIADTDNDGVKNYLELDSDNDLCNDVIEAGFTDPDGDGRFGNSPITVDLNGRVIGAPYTTPNPNYLIIAPIVITTQPTVLPTCELQNASITLVDNGGNTYQWQVSTDKGANWNDITNNAPYSGATTNTLSITSVTNAMFAYKYRVQLSRNGNSCGLTSDGAVLIVYPLPVVKDIEIIQCDDDLDLQTDFNLRVKNDLISSNSANENFTYYTSLAGANTEDPSELISTPEAFQNINPPLPAIQGLMYVWARVSNKITGCFSTAKLTLKVAASKIPLTYSYYVTPVCDDILATDGTSTGDPNTNKRDGISAFDLTNAIKDVESQLPPPLSNYTIKYYRNKVDALAQNDVVGNSLAIKPSEYTNFRNDIPFAQNIWVRVNNNLTSDCGDGFGDFIKLKVEKLPFAHPVIIPRQCDDNQDGVFTFNTTSLESDLLLGQTGVAVTYFDSSNNPLRDSNNNLITSPFPATFTTTSQIIKAVVTNTTAQACSYETKIEFIVDKSPIDFTIPTTETTTCDDESEPSLQNGQYNFTNSQAIHDIVTLGQPAGMIIEYYDENNVLLSSPLPNPLPVTLTKKIKIVVYNLINPTCSITKTITFIVNPVPTIELASTELVCSNNPTFFVLLNAGITDATPQNAYSYIWLKDGVTIPLATAYTLNVNVEGIYTVKVINANGCYRIRTITVIASDVAHFGIATIMDLSDNNTVIINATGLGDYVYSMDYPNAYQAINIFTDVPAGIHTVYVKDLNGCGTSSQVISVIGIPPYFTPNADGINDTWNVKGLTATNNYNTTIYIFDRYGKLLKQLGALETGWDGTFNGNMVPSDDYWYTIYFEDGRTAKGNFTLKR